MTTGIPISVADLIRESQSTAETFTAQEMVQLPLHFAYLTKNYYEYALNEATKTKLSQSNITNTAMKQWTLFQKHSSSTFIL